MLLIDRKVGTSVVIRTASGEEIKLTIVSQGQFGTKIGFEADRSIEILREEIITRENRRLKDGEKHNG